MTSHCAEPIRPIDQYRANATLLSRRVAGGSLVCVPAQSAYQDVRVLRLDAIATDVVALTREPRSVAAITAALAAHTERDEVGVPDERGAQELQAEIASLVAGLAAARVLEHC